MKPGIYLDIPNEQYHREIDALSSSGLRLLDRSPAHYREAMENPPEPTPAMALGSAFHSLMLEPDTFDDNFAVAPDINRRTKAGKEAYAAFEAENKGKAVILPDDFDQIRAMKIAALKSETVRGIFSSMHTERTIIWNDPLYGFACKCRPDIENPAIEFLWDLKTCVDASPDGFSRDAARFGYHLQADWYLTGANVAHGRTVYRNFGFICVEKSPPYAVQVYVADAEFMNAGKEKNSILRNKYELCLRGNKWPGYPDRVVPLSLPRWAV